MVESVLVMSRQCLKWQIKDLLGIVVFYLKC
jgi:hypothetical protein